MDDEGIPLAALREIKSLKMLAKHQNVVQLMAVQLSVSAVWLVFEHMDRTLAELVRAQGGRLSSERALLICSQLLEGVAFLHSCQLVHRDITSSNLLIDHCGTLKIGDFGAARLVGGSAPLTSRVVTLWYRPLELLLGSDSYGTAVDMWSCGCVIAELAVGRPVLQGQNEVEQIALIFELCGAPTRQTWPEVERLPLWEVFDPLAESPSPGGLECLVSDKIYMQLDNPAVSSARCGSMDRLVDLLVVLDPLRRGSAQAALEQLAVPL